MSALHRSVTAGRRPEAGTSAARRARLAALLPERGDRWTWAALLGGLVALVAACLLPLAPVQVNEPTLSWPLDPERPQSSAALLTTYRPAEFDLRFSCDAAQAVGADGVLFSTVVPEQGGATSFGLVVSAASNRLTVDSAGTRLLDEPLRSTCDYEVRADSADAGVALLRDGREVAHGPPKVLPEVEAFVSGITTLPGGTADDLSISVRASDEFASSPSSIKIVLLVLVGLGLAVALVAGLRITRPVDRATRRFPAVALHWVDLVVVATLVGWLFLAPQTDDDGYYSAMAENYRYEGYVANYYQLYNQNFTPFTWFYTGLQKWQLMGHSPVLLRIPALVFALVTWVLLRTFVAGCLKRFEWPDRPGWFAGGRITLAEAVLGLVFLSWWVPFDMGVRPEGVVAMCAAGSMLAVAAAIERSDVRLIALAVGVSSIGFAVHPTGFVALAPLIAGLPGLWRVLRAETWAQTVVRTVLVLVPVGFASLLAFADASLRDFRMGQDIFLDIQDQDAWFTEINRYEFLLTDNPMGNFAKRIVVLVALVMLGWFAVTYVWSRAVRAPMPPRMTLAAASTGFAFVLLWLTPSKWSHHFGSMAGAGPVFLALCLLLLPLLVRRLCEERGAVVHWTLQAILVVSFVTPIALAGHGPNTWPYAWNFGLPKADIDPQVGFVKFGQPAWWLLGSAALCLLLWRLLRGMEWRRFAGVLTVPVLVAVGFVLTLGYTLGAFSLAAKRTWDTYSLQSANLQDPWADDCSAGSAIQVLDEGSAVPLASVGPRTVVAGGFVAGAGWYPTAEPPARVGTGAMSEVWGTYTPRADGELPETTTGRMVTGWYRLPAAAPDSEVAVLAAGLTGGGDDLVVEYGSGTRVVGSAVLGLDPTTGGKVDALAWRSLVVPPAPPGVDSIRINALDGAGGPGGWLAFTAPTLQRYERLDRYIPHDAPTAVDWRLAFSFPCLRKPKQEDGVTELAQYGVLWGLGLEDGFREAIWQKFRGSAYARLRTSTGVFHPYSRFPDFPGVQPAQVLRFVSDLAPDAYRIDRSERTQSGFRSTVTE